MHLGLKEKNKKEFWEVRALLTWSEKKKTIVKAKFVVVNNKFKRCKVKPTGALWKISTLRGLFSILWYLKSEREAVM